jgi:hypothetical protein
MAQSVQGKQTNLICENCICSNSSDAYQSSLVQPFADDCFTLQFRLYRYRFNVLNSASLAWCFAVANAENTDAGF